MTKKEYLDTLVKTEKGVLLIENATKYGISKTYLMEYVRKTNMERVAKGIYLSQDAWSDYFYLLQQQYPQVIFSHETALYLLDMAPREPLRFTVTAKPGYHVKSMEERNIKVYRIKKELFELGVIEIVTPVGHIVRAYNAERTLCDLLRSRKNIEIQDLQNALKEYAKSKKKNIPKLMSYAKEFHVEKLLRPYMGVLL